MADGSASKGIGDEDENHLTISDKSINVASEVYGDVAGKNEPGCSSVSEVSEQRVQTYANKEKMYLRIRSSANEKGAHYLPNVNTEEKPYTATIDEVYEEMRNMASVLQEVHNVVTKPPTTTPPLPPVLQVNARLEQPFKWQDLLSQLMIIGAGFLALFFAGKKIDQVRLAAGKKFDEAMLEVRDARKSWEADGRPSLVTNRFALWNKGETSSRASKKDGPESSPAESSGTSKKKRFS